MPGSSPLAEHDTPCPCNRAGLGCMNYRVNEQWPYYNCIITGKPAYVPQTEVGEYRIFGLMDD